MVTGILEFLQVDILYKPHVSQHSESLYDLQVLN